MYNYGQVRYACEKKHETALEKYNTAMAPARNAYNRKEMTFQEFDLLLNLERAKLESVRAELKKVLRKCGMPLVNEERMW